MGDVCDEFAALALGLLQGVRHVVERFCQLCDLGHALVIVHAHVEIALGEAARRLRHLVDGARLAHADPRAHDEREQQYRHRRHEKQSNKRAPHRRQRPRAGHRQHKADGCALAHDRHADDEVRVLIDVAERGAHGVGVIAHRALGHVLRHGQHAVDESCIGR